MSTISTLGQLYVQRCDTPRVRRSDRCGGASGGVGDQRFCRRRSGDRGGAGMRDRPRYPSAHQVLLDAIAERGAVVSEYPPGTAPALHRFLVRNRLIAAMGETTVVVEAGRRSGSTATFRAARELNRVAAAVPAAGHLRAVRRLSRIDRERRGVAGDRRRRCAGTSGRQPRRGGQGAGVGRGSADRQAVCGVGGGVRGAARPRVPGSVRAGRGAGLFADDTLAAVAELEPLGTATTDGANCRRVRAVVARRV